MVFGNRVTEQIQLEERRVEVSAGGAAPLA